MHSEIIGRLTKMWNPSEANTSDIPLSYGSLKSLTSTTLALGLALALTAIALTLAFLAKCGY
jgi:hypothetical protein